MLQAGIMYRINGPLCAGKDHTGKFCYLFPAEAHESVRVLIPTDQSGRVPESSSGLHCSILPKYLEPIEMDWSI